VPAAGPALNPDAIRAIREAHGYSVAELAISIGIAPAHMSNVEAGRRGISGPVVTRLARALRVRPAAILATECKKCTAQRVSQNKVRRAS
jgi:transcriptional regulator with XRE-family HTH domain